MTKTQARGFGIFSFLALAISVAAFAAKPVIGAAAIGETNVSASAIQWQASGSYERLILTVSGPEGSSLSKEFEAGRAATLRVQELGARVPADGQYSWELRVVPRVSAETKQQLAAAREAGDDQAVARIQVEAGLNRDIVRSGAFVIQSGSFVLGVGEEPATPGGHKVVANALKPAPLDVVTPDDAIIQGSLCVGLDCVVNENFGFDTIRLKENNTRIKFDDTSTSAGFPANDWQLTANDSASGGANKFSIDDTTNNKTPFTVTGNSPTNSIFVASSGKVGFRTGAPVLDLHIATSDTPAIRQEQTSAGGFTAQTWDIGANEANWFVRDVTGGSRLPFRIRPNAPTSSIDISASGNVGVGTSSPVARLDVRGTNAHALVGSGTSDFIGGTQTGYGASNGTEQLFFAVQTGLSFLGSVSNTSLGLITNNSTKVLINSAGNVGINCSAPASQLVIASGSPCNVPTSSINAGSAQFTVASSRTFKENIAPVKVSDILNKIESVPVVTYDFKGDGPKDRLGLIAEDFHQVFARGDEKYIDGQEVQMALWLAVQQLTAQNKELTDRLNALEKQLASNAKTQQ